MNPRFSKFYWMASLLLMTGPALAQVPLVLRLPPEPTSLAVLGMGGAVGADGTYFNASAYNPALLGRSTHSVEIDGPGFDLSNGFFETLQYIQNLQFQADQVYYDLDNGLATNNYSEISTGLTQVQGVIENLTDKALQGGAWLNAAVKIDPHWGVQVYTSAHAMADLWRGNLTQALLNIPLPYTAASNPALANAVTVMAGDLQTGINQVLTPQQQSSVQTDINNLKNGQETIQTFASNVASTLSGVDLNALKQALLNSLANDLGTLTALAYWDTVFMGTYRFEPFGNIPGLSLGANLKIVNRHFSYEAFTVTDKGLGNLFLNNFKQSSTRWGVDLGALYELPAFPLDLGLSFQDLLHQDATVSVEPGGLANGFKTDPAPTVVRFGASWHPLPGLRVDADLDDIFSTTTFYTNSDSFSRFKFGTGYSPLPWFQLRAGFGDQVLSAGLGLDLAFFGLDYSFAADDVSQAYNHYAQMRLVF